MPSPGGDRAGPRLGLAALSFAISIGQAANEPAVLVTVPLHRTDAHASDTPPVSVSDDGRFVAFVSAASLLPADTNDRDDIYVLDRETGDVSLETLGSLVADDRPVISATGRFLVYACVTQVLMVRDRVAGTVRPLQRGREPPDASSRDPAISSDGRYVAFTSSATNLVDGSDPNGQTEDVYVADTSPMTFRRIAVPVPGLPPAAITSFAPAITGDGRFVAFSATAPFDAAAGTKGRKVSTYVHDSQTGTTAIVSVSAAGGAPDGASYSPAISRDGRYVAFVSDATNLVRRHDRDRSPQVYVRDTIANTTEIVSRTPSGHAGNASSRHPALSGDGRIVVFQSEASDLTCGERCPPADRDINLVADIFRFDRRTRVTELISRGRTPWMEPSIGPAVDGSGDVIAFSSRHPLDQADDRHDYDLFVWARRRTIAGSEDTAWGSDPHEVRRSATARGTPAGRDTASRTWTTTARR